MKTNDQALLEAALIGYQHQADQIAEKIAEIRLEISGKAPAAAARKRIAAAQKKRWAEYHRLKEGTA
jgi:hypothetical protein